MTLDRSPAEGLAQMTIGTGATILEALRVIDRGAESIGFVTDESGRVLGCITDGDVRRALLAGATLESRCLSSIMRADFAFVRVGTGRAEVLDLMRARQIGELPVLDAEGHLAGLHTVRQIISAVERPNRVVILAGGKGTRLYPLTLNLPKPMVTVAGRPILERLVLHLMSCGFRQFTLSVNYLAHVIEQHFGDGGDLGCQIDYLRETEPLGTGGSLALLAARPAHPLLVLNGDLVTQCDVGRMLDFHLHGKFVATFGLKPYSVTIPFGVAEVEGDQLVGLREKPTERMMINAGIYVLDPDTLDLIPKGREFPITDLFSRLLEQGRPVGAHVLEDDWLDVGRHEELTRARGGS
jgi:dTDP-glucose pyrophosphorylase